MILVIQYKDRDDDYVNYSVLELVNLEKVAVKLREAIVLSTTERNNYDAGCIYLEFYKDGEELSGAGKWAHQFVYTALETITKMMEKHP